MNGPSRRGLCRWISEATSSFPTPVSPVTRTAVVPGATRATSSSTSLSAGESPTIRLPGAAAAVVERQ